LLATFFESAMRELGFFPAVVGLPFPAGLFGGGTIFATAGFGATFGLPDGFDEDFEAGVLATFWPALDSLAVEREEWGFAAEGFVVFFPVLAGAKAADFNLTRGLPVVTLALLAGPLEPSDFCAVM
jgi:hypothetical protein